MITGRSVERLYSFESLNTANAREHDVKQHQIRKHSQSLQTLFASGKGARLVSPFLGDPVLEKP